MREIVIDARGAILGRLASFVAKQAILGNKIVVVNCEEVVITGKPKSVIEEYKELRSKGGASLHGPFFPKHSDRIVKRTIRGMVSRRQQRGKDALSRIRCHIGVPEEFEDTKKIIAGKERRSKSIKLLDLSKQI